MDPLFQPITINKTEIKNRMCMTAMQMNMISDYEMTDRLCEFYAGRARGGTGLICVGFVSVDRGGSMPLNIGGPDDTYVPEAVFGLDFEHRLSKRQKFTLSNEFAPDVTALDDFRLNTQAGWKVVIDEEMNLSLKLSVLNRYDATPHGAKPNDVDYSAVLLWSF